MNSTNEHLNIKANIKDLKGETHNDIVSKGFQYPTLKNGYIMQTGNQYGNVKLHVKPD